ncbi:MAG TPA: hypothetical protein V6C69_04860 [Trichormus sp.]|jgi:copper chaperone CopZ
MPNKLTADSYGVTHHLPHRTRLRLPKQHRHAINKVKDRLKKVPGVKDVHVNERTGSILIEHDEKQNVLENVGTAVQEVASDLFDSLIEMQESEVPGLSIVAHLVKSQAGKLDTKVATATDNWLDLKTLFPVALLGAGVYTAVKEKAWLGLGEIPAFVFFWYAYDAYMKFHGPSVRAESVAERVETSDGKLQNPVIQDLKRRNRKEVT